MVTLGVFATSRSLVLIYPLSGLALCCCCLIVYLKPEAPGAD